MKDKYAECCLCKHCQEKESKDICDDCRFGDHWISIEEDADDFDVEYSDESWNYSIRKELEENQDWDN